MTWYLSVIEDIASDSILHFAAPKDLNIRRIIKVHVGAAGDNLLASITPESVKNTYPVRSA